MNSADDMTKFWRCAKRNDECTARVQIGRDAAYEQMIRSEAPAKKRKNMSMLMLESKNLSSAIHTISPIYKSSNFFTA
jgi:hypothetical protein